MRTALSMILLIAAGCFLIACGQGGTGGAGLGGSSSVPMSDGVPDEVISPIPRFATLTRNIRTRRGEKVQARYPNKQWYGAKIIRFAQGKCECSNGRLGCHCCCDL